MKRLFIASVLFLSSSCEWPIGVPKPLGPTPDCGDSYLTSDETCDDGNDVTEQCEYGELECEVCDSSCQLSPGPTRYCGDGVTQSDDGEECDEASLNSDDAGCLEGCISAICGDGLLRMDVVEGIDGYEACDDGDANSDAGACLSNCVVASCGDGFRRQDIPPGDEGYEACDDGPDDSEICDAFDCSFAECGDGYTNEIAQENCDDGNRITERCPDDEPECQVCGRDCVTVAGSFCGDGVVNEAFGEECDDGNDDNTDSCLNSCVSARCGDGFVYQGVEVCDDGNEIENDACLSSCLDASCGDGIVRSDLEVGLEGYEYCDDGNLVNTDGCLNQCTIATCGDGFIRRDLEEGDIGFEFCDDGGESVECRSDCIVSSCGDAYVNTTAGETCDDGNAITEQCPTDDLCFVCGRECVQSEGARCGDGFTDILFGEQCDDGDAVDTGNGCSAECQKNNTCGDGILEPIFETCDDGFTDACGDCNEDCTGVGTGYALESDGESPNYCGDGEICEQYEACDDNNVSNDDGCLASCIVASCGDGYVRNDVDDVNDPLFEECDDGDESPFCRIDCRVSSCGDGYINASAGETCDDGNTVKEACPGDIPCDVCGELCTVVPGAICGDGMTDVLYGEQCDDGNTIDDANGCSADCQKNNSCGDGIVEPVFELCDDGFNDACGTCNSDCTAAGTGYTLLNNGSSPNYCGDGELCEEFEACDDSNVENTDSCLASCQIATCGDGFTRLDILPGANGYEACDDGGQSENCKADCTLSSCGDGFTNIDAGEECDDGNLVTEACPADDLSCTVCGDVCKIVAGLYCGDGIVSDQFGEECDDGNRVDDLNGCSADCKQNNVCGDGIVQLVFEVCDDGFTDACGDCNADCSAPGTGYSVGGLTSVNYCGDGSICQQFEECDDGNTDNDDGCVGACQLAVCGDGFVRQDLAEGVEGFENCDDGDSEDSGNGCDGACLRNDVCGDGNTQDLFETCDDGFADACGDCNETCSGNGSGSSCGDGDLCPQYEECDDGNNRIEVCEYGGIADCLVCGDVCQEVPGIREFCGDGIVQPEYETCDLGAAGNTNLCPEGVNDCMVCSLRCQDEVGIPNCDDCGGGGGDCGDAPLFISYQDFDFDGYGNPESTIETCFTPIGYVDNNFDCDDTRTMVNPGAPEICDGVDDNCNGIVDDGLLGTQRNCAAPSCIEVLRDRLPGGSQLTWVGDSSANAQEILCDYGTVGDGWSFLRSVSVTNGTDSVWSNEEVKVLVDVTALAASGKMQSRGEDIRFFTSDAGLLSYWIGQKTDLGYEVWVTIPSLDAGETLEFSLAYGNPQANSKSLTSYFDDFRIDSTDDYSVVHDSNWAFNPEFEWDVTGRFKAASFPDYFLMVNPELLALSSSVYVEVAGYWSDDELDGLGPVVRDGNGAYYVAVVTDDYDGNQYTTGIDGIIEYSATPADHKQGRHVGTVVDNVATRNGIRIGLAVSGTSLEMFVDGVSVLGVSNPDLNQVDWAGLASISNIGGSYDYLWVGAAPPPFDPLGVNTSTVTVLGAEEAF